MLPKNILRPHRMRTHARQHAHEVTQGSTLVRSHVLHVLLATANPLRRYSRLALRRGPAVHTLSVDLSTSLPNRRYGSHLEEVDLVLTTYGSHLEEVDLVLTTYGSHLEEVDLERVTDL
eukprot:3362635-Prymnesium_polylepis.1